MDTKKHTIEQALFKTKEQQNQSPVDARLVLVESQLNYVRKVLSGKRPYRMRLSRIDLAAFVSLFSSDPAYANLLARSQQIADEMLTSA